MTSPIAVVEKLLADTRVCLKIQPRNAYQAEGAYMSSMERLKEAREKISGFSGEYVDRLLKEVDELERAVNEMILARTNSVETLLGVDFGEEEGEDGNDEATLVARELEKKREEKKKRSKAKAKSKKTERKGKEGQEKETGDNVGVGPSSKPEETEHQVENEETTVVGEVKVLTTYADCKSRDIPQEVVGSGKCIPVLNTPLAHLLFDTVVEYDGCPCTVRVALHRAVVVALTFGRPPSSTIESANESKVEATDSDNVGDGVVVLPEVDDNLAKMLVDEDLLVDVESDENEDDVADGDAEDDGGATAELSKQLVAEFDAIQEEKKQEEEGGGSKRLPSDISTKLWGSIRSFTFLPWVILMCHGGYFAGGVFIEGEPVAHKAFQRYVVRKKQGGKQSSNEKEGGSYGSIGSQIRRAQEIRWRVEVRDILMRWRNYINAAALVLYVAPGPKNRAVLTDFSTLPATTLENGERAVSPVNLRDPRVHKAPLTTHRPCFQEVQRIYGTVSTCTVDYVLQTD
ncbi:hypothetical protein, conserved [Trypanosoma brucei gambiense DAL972]|uniref:VLRF1 domain-containing protein n=1 Tax=Trypanosoma brucei gambiense (strain MHOM/CI/86/DAL972) TaxID=679716 RepID=C9ZYE4_TRYB9|nr:hypothetical protein, conserved [Trypanosoma brucei gambiense DAL972]CBH14443.1 hypothetical protein, conserved [Trypanosoma brucei gambiense DAL972]|eukprot:XP_011776709.1 hypothetical protein, conserved [Trypanosoma brucei gambiense DAL972]